MKTFQEIVKNISLDYAELIADLIKKYNLNQNNFQNLYECLQLKTVNIFLKKKQWYGCEEYFQDHQQMLQILCSELQKRGDSNEFDLKAAWSIICRNKLPKHENLQNKCENSPLIENPIFIKDSFGPQEENIGIQPPNTFISLKEFGIQEKDVVFVDNINHENFALAMDCLNASDIVI